MEELKTFGFEKTKTKVHQVSFRLTEAEYALLESLFGKLKVHSRKDRISDKMVRLLRQVDGIINENVELRKARRKVESQTYTLMRQKKSLEDQRKKLYDEAAQLIIRKQPSERTPKTEPEPPPRTEPKSEPVTPTQVTKKPDVIQPIERTHACAHGHKFPTKEQCDRCAYHDWCNYSSANKHFKGPA